MDSPMDFDFDLDDDKINSFLLNKLEEIKAKNEKLGLTLRDRRQSTHGTAENLDVEMDESDIKVSPHAWKKIFNDKYILGVTIENNGSRCLRNPKAVLRWDSSYSLSYRVFLYEENTASRLTPLTCLEENCNIITNSLKQSDGVDKRALLVVTIQVPKFTEKLFYKVTGDLIFQQGDRNVTLVFPEVEISAYDATGHDLHNCSLFNGDTKNILTVISGTDETRLVLILPRDWSNSFDSTFEILCSLTKVQVAANCRKFFVAHKLSPQFDDSLLIFHTAKHPIGRTYTVNVYCRNEGSLLSLLHHLHQNIPGVLIIPNASYENYIQQHPESIFIEEEASALRECIKTEINHVETFLRESQGAKNADKNDFFQKFVDSQLDTDTHHIKLLKANSQLLN